MDQVDYKYFNVRSCKKQNYLLHLKYITHAFRVQFCYTSSKAKTLIKSLIFEWIAIAIRPLLMLAHNLNISNNTWVLTQLQTTIKA